MQHPLLACRLSRPKSSFFYTTMQLMTLNNNNTRRECIHVCMHVYMLINTRVCEVNIYLSGTVLWVTAAEKKGM